MRVMGVDISPSFKLPRRLPRLGAMGRASAARRTPGARDRAQTDGALQEVVGFGANLGDLRMLTYLPDALPARPALVVVLHGCTQTAAGYDLGTGWSALADEQGFALLFPEQTSANNPRLCFNWFQSGDITRGSGEAASIREMIETMIVRHGVDRDRIFVTGLSAGGAMAGVMMAAYPEVFAAGGVIAGLPYGSATSVQQALQSMYSGDRRSASAWGGLVRAASVHGGPWPRVSVWHGDADTTVVPMNAGEIAKQWADVHGLPDQPSERTADGRFSTAVWRDATGASVIESVTVQGMAHGAPLAVGAGDEQGGAAGPFLLDVGLSSTHGIARFFGLVDAAAPAPRAPRPQAPATLEARAPAPERAAPDHAGDVRGMIEGALRAAGLMK